MGSFTKLAVVLIAAVLLSNAQCLASCTVSSCNSGIPAQSSQDVPPCHHHHQKQPVDHSSQAPCHYFVLPGTSASLLAQVLLVDPLIAAPPVSADLLAQSVAVVEASEAHASPPPLPSIVSSVVLRV